MFVEHAAHGSILSCNTALDARVSGCAAEYYRKPGVAERCEGPNATDTACSTAVLDGTASTCTAAATATSGDCVHTASTPETCNACGRVRDAKEDAVQNCTNANDTRVAQCREDPVKGEYTLVRGATGVAPTPDTCWDTPPSVYLSYDGDYDAVTRTASAYDAFEASFKEKLGEFLRIPVNRVAVESVVPGSVGVYFYLLQRAPSAPLNEYGVEEAYAYLDSAFTSGTLELQFPGGVFSSALVLPIDVPDGYEPPPPPPPPVICREVVEFDSCVDSGCAWERNREKCWTVEEAIEDDDRQTRLVIYLITLGVIAVAVLATCCCYAWKCC